MDSADKIQQILGMKSSAIDARSSLVSKFEKYWDLYNSYIERQNIPWKSQLFLKETFRSIDTIKPYFMQMLFMSTDPFEVIVLDEEKAHTAEQIQKLISYFIEKAEMYLPMEDFVLEMLIYGTAFSKLIWDKQISTREVEEIVTRDPILATLLPGEEGSEETEVLKQLSPEVSMKTMVEVIKNQPAMYNINYRDIFFAPTARNLDDTWVIHRTYRNMSDLIEENKRVKAATGQNKYQNLSKLKEDLMFYQAVADKYSDGEGAGLQTQFQSIGIDTPSKSELKKPLKNDDGELEILEYWNKEATEVITIAAGLRIIKETNNPYAHGKKPFLSASYIRRPGKIWGIGVAELAEGGQDLLNTAVNQAVDSNTLANNLMIAVSSEANFNADDAQARPGGFIILDTDDKPIGSVLQQMQFTKVDTSNEIALAKDEIQSTTGANAFMQGSYQSGAVRNNGQQQALMSAGSNKFQGKILTFENMFLKPFVRQFYSLLGQYVNKDTVVAISGRNGMSYEKVDMAQLSKDVDFIPKGSRQLSEMSQSLHEINNFLSVASAIPQAQQIVNFRYLIKKMWVNLSSDHDVEQVILPDYQSELNQQQSLMEQGMGPDGVPIQPPGTQTNSSTGNSGGGRQV